MPYYEYQCQKCKKELEVLQKITEPPLKKCPKCKGKLNKLISQTAFQLKGTGWYVTDFRNKGKKKDKGTKDEGQKNEVKKEETKKEGEKKEMKTTELPKSTSETKASKKTD